MKRGPIPLREELIEGLTAAIDILSDMRATGPRLRELGELVEDLTRLRVQVAGPRMNWMARLHT
jgi:hypothetical protein